MFKYVFIYLLLSRDMLARAAHFSFFKQNWKDLHLTFTVNVCLPRLLSETWTDGMDVESQNEM